MTTYTATTAHLHALPPNDSYTTAKSEAEAIRKDLDQMVDTLDRAAFVWGMRSIEATEAKRRGDEYVAYRARQARRDAQDEVARLKREIRTVLDFIWVKDAEVKEP